MVLDDYKSIKTSVRAEYKEKGSRFIAVLYPCSTVEAFADGLGLLKQEFSTARHFCYAYRLNADGSVYRVNDDGEPSGSAGLPIYNQLLSAELVNVACVIIRYFGGTKLGVSGLIKAYKIATGMAIDESQIQLKKVQMPVKIAFEYANTADVQRFISQLDVGILDEQHSDKHYCTLGVPPSILEEIKEQLNAHHLIITFK